MPDDNTVPPNPDAPPVPPEPSDGGEVAVVSLEDRRVGSGGGHQETPLDSDPAHSVPVAPPPGPSDGTTVPPVPPVVSEPGP